MQQFQAVLVHREEMAIDGTELLGHLYQITTSKFTATLIFALG
jgi:hypothetical protein